MTTTEERTGSPTTAAYKLILENLVTKPRIVSLGGLSLIAIILGIAVRANSGNADVDIAESTYKYIVNGYSLLLLIPVTALVFASAALGDLAEDGTLVYLWLKPVERWRLVLAALAATLSIALPVAVIPATLAAIIGGGGSRVALGALAGSALATFGYSTVFLGLGLLVRRALAWGLAYILIWEAAVSRVARGAARLSIEVYARSLLAHIARRSEPLFGTSITTALIVVVIISVLAVVLTVWALARDEVP